MEIRSRAPLRIGLAGGGTDLPDYSNKFGGAVFNATIDMYSYCTIIPTNDGKIEFVAPDRGESISFPSTDFIPVEEPLILHKGVYNRIIKEFNGGKPLSFKMSTSSDAPAGSGLGTSSTMVVTILEAFDKWLNLGLSLYQKALLAYDIERHDIGLSGGKQDQYAAVFGGFNFMEFNKDGSTIVNTLRMDETSINELECSLLLFYSGKSRDSAKIIDQQIKNTKDGSSVTLQAMDNLKKAAYNMKDYLLQRDFKGFAQVLRDGWENKKKTSSIVSNETLNNLIDYAMKNGAEAVKVSGAGGGGFIMIYCSPINRQRLFNALKETEGIIYPVSFTQKCVCSWIV